MTRRRSLIEDERAAVYVEFLVVFWPLFFLFLGTMQIGMAMSADLALQHSADMAARSAIVVLPDDPQFNGDNAKNELNYNSTANPGFVDKALGLIESLSGSSLASLFAGSDVSTSFMSNLFSKGDTRLNSIRFAAFRPMLPFAPHPSEILDPRSTIIDAIDGAGARLLFGFVYNMGALSITFPETAGGPIQTADPISYGGNTPVTVRATYLFHCGVPFVGQMMCKAASQIHLQSEEGKAELDMAVAPSLINALAVMGVGSAIGGGKQACFLVLRREATLTYQGAAYQFRSED